MKNRVISLVKLIWYSVSEYLRLRIKRAFDGDGFGVPFGSIPLVSVYIPTHNRKDLLLSRALPSVLKQSYPNIEIIVVAHGCTDGTELACRTAYGREVKIVTLARKQTYPPSLENHWFAGRVAASNEGLRHCTGQWIATIDDDDAWDRYHIETALGFAISNGYEFVSACGDNKNGLIPPYDVNGVKVGPVQTWLYRSYLSFFKFNPDCWRKFWNRVCDTDLQDRFRRAGVKMGFLNRTNVHIIPRPGDKDTGLKAARGNPETYMKHLSFKEIVNVPARH